MLRKISTLLAVAIFIVFATKLYSQEKPVQQKFAKKIDADAEINVPLTNTGAVKGAKGELIFNTNYDYPANSQTRPMLVLDDFDGDGVKNPVMVGMSRLASNVDGNRYENLALRVDVSTWVVFSVYDVNKYTGWGSIQSVTSGNLAGNALIMAHQSGATVPAIYNYDMDEVTEGPAFASYYPSFAYSPVNNKTMYLGLGGAFSTTTPWTSFDSLNTVAGFFAQVSGDTSLGTNFDSEIGVHVSPDGNHFSAFSTVERAGNAFDGTSLDSVNLASLIYSNDAGETWNYEEVAKCGVTGTISNRPDYAPLFANFGQSQSLVDNNGVVHLGINGYSVDMANDTVAVFPALYWNSRDKHFIALTDITNENDPNIITSYPGNGIGNAYESVGTTADGGFVFVAWQSPEYKDGNLNIYSSTGKYYTNISYAYSVDGGRTFSEPQILVGATDVDECYPYVADEVEYNSDKGTVTVHYLYYLDIIPGVSLFPGGGDGSDDGAWYYDSIEIPYSPSGVNDQQVVTNYSLSQNYPNPFNPTTQISFALKVDSKVQLNVYNLLGQVVASKVYGNLNAGTHNYTFDGSNLTSGVYFYDINVEGVDGSRFSATKKMMLLK